MVVAEFIHSGKIGSSAIFKGFYQIVLAGLIYVYSGIIGSFWIL